MTAPDTAHSALKSDHGFTPRNRQWWELCRKCGLARAAHVKVSKTALALERQQKTTKRGTEDVPDE